MATARPGILKFVALLLLLPGLAGFIVSAMVSTRYLQTMPRQPLFDQNRFVPREIHGTVIYQTPQEDRDLNLVEYSSVAVFSFGVVFGLVYLNKWSSAAQQQAAGQEHHFLHHAR